MPSPVTEEAAAPLAGAWLPGGVAVATAADGPLVLPGVSPPPPPSDAAVTAVCTGSGFTVDVSASDLAAWAEPDVDAAPREEEEEEEEDCWGRNSNEHRVVNMSL